MFWAMCAMAFYFSCGVLLIFLYLAYRILAKWMLVALEEEAGDPRADDSRFPAGVDPVSYVFQLFVHSGLECL